MKHTPAPWNIKKGEYNYDIRDKYNVPICYNVTKPNIRLMAAAPGLLVACKNVLDIIIAYQHIPAQFKACQILQDAIRNAEE